MDMYQRDDDAYEDGRYRQVDHDGYPATSLEMVRGPKYLRDEEQLKREALDGRS